MKNRFIVLSCGAAVLAMFAFWNGEATAQPNSSGSSELPMTRNCTVTLDARANSRSTMAPEMQAQSGFVRQDTVQGVLIRVTAEWLVLKDGESENWIPRDKVLLLRVSR